MVHVVGIGIFAVWKQTSSNGHYPVLLLRYWVISLKFALWPCIVLHTCILDSDVVLKQRTGTVSAKDTVIDFQDIALHFSLLTTLAREVMQSPLSICLSVCLFLLCLQNQSNWLLPLNFYVWAGHDRSSQGIEDQRHGQANAISPTSVEGIFF